MKGRDGRWTGQTEMAPRSTRPFSDEDLEVGRGDTLGSDPGQPVTSQAPGALRKLPYPGAPKWTLIGEARMRGGRTWSRPARAPRSHLGPCLASHGEMRTVGIPELWIIMM